MRGLHWSPDCIVDDFHKVAALAGRPLEREISVEILPAPHEPTPLPEDQMAVYVFSSWGQTLKVGKVGPKSYARYTSQHYSPKSSKSNLANSLLRKGEDFGFTDIDSESIGEWIKTNTHRVNFLLPTRTGDLALNLLEVFLQCRLNPLFEGMER